MTTPRLLNFLRGAGAAAVVLAAFAPMPAAAAIVSYDFSVTLDSGPLAPQSFNGELSFDDAVSGTNAFGDTTHPLTAFSFDFNGQTFGLGDALGGTELLWTLPLGGGTAGLDAQFATFAFIPGDGALEPYFLYDLAVANGGTGSVEYRRQRDGGTIPEPATLALAAIAALGALAAGRRRRR